MSRPRRPDPADLAARLASAKLMVAGLKDAMPSLAAEMRRTACEAIEDVIEDLGRLSR